jgi:hypothetical protein
VLAGKLSDVPVVGWKHVDPAVLVVECEDHCIFLIWADDGKIVEDISPEDVSFPV